MPTTITAPDEVLAVLASSACTVPAPPGTPDAARLLAMTARWSEGTDHDRRRALAVAALPVAAEVLAEARRRTTAALAGREGRLDVMPLARTVPVAAVAAAAGVDDADVDDAVELTGRWCDATAPRSAPYDPPDGDAAARALVTVLARSRRPDGSGGTHEGVAAIAGLLLQIRDATSGLIGAALLASVTRGRDTPARPAQGSHSIMDGPALVEHVLASQAPVRSTRRVLASSKEVVVALDDVPFGAGRHACPGRDVAVAAATGVLTALDDGAWRPVPCRQPGWEPRPNLRIPERVEVERA